MVTLTQAWTWQLLRKAVCAKWCGVAVGAGDSGVGPGGGMGADGADSWIEAQGRKVGPEEGAGFEGD